jgi:tungstate transport system permease protein
LNFVIDSFLKSLGLVLGLDAEIYFIVWTSVKVSFFAIVSASILGIPLGSFLALKEFKGKSLVIILLNTMMAFPTVVIGLILYMLLSRRGPLGEWEILYSPTGITLGLFVLALPTVVNLTLSAIKSLDSKIILTCRSLGATYFQEMMKLLSEARFAVMAAIVMAFGRVISEVGIAMMLGGNIKGFTRTMTTAIALETSKGDFELGLSLGIVLMTVALLINGFLFLLQRTK